MSGLQPPRGTHDLIGDTMRRHHHVVETARRVLRTYGFEEWSTPIFEDTRVFSRTLGETSDVVSKEMYTFEDRGGESITLRPEGTAAICRALVTNGLTQSLPQKVFYHGPMFRYERPQKGRYRQFHQIGAELIGAESPLRDAETIAMAQDILRELGLGDHVTLELNTLGDLASRQAWREALVAYFRDHADALSEESRVRLEANPLRILDSKSEQDRKLLDDAPAFADYLNDESRQFWDTLRSSLQAFGVDFVENPRIVRGLDYYSHTAFEFVTSKLGAQGTVLAGGRYEGLVEQMGGPAIPAIGWAGGIERLAMLLDSVPELPAGIALVPMGDEAVLKAASLARALRSAGLRAEIETRGNMKKRMERVVKSGASHAVVLGDEEIAKDVVQLRDLSSREQQEVPFADLVRVLSAGRA
ncbi:histidine--tRNA ligase [Gluconobacter albidus]|uniref:Histidine--tRNA ligase n=1 Tax=Gluconobacter albidus TaxID=318683 RepID=A0AAW3QVD3_9PROT|nr:histidine--tRNA ligase [Gluconobacter albidus]AQS90785.1 histidine--tRNA ligase [Gluconobacter albidus]KXV37261.1 histidyl-tRNA synthetase [Gluconobacter albidus]GBQ88821.1 histidyl-tRNA synthetase [Gluconobacter albidus NBRC 3250]GLQ69099.1 histidine--tRNA ligase [Gluconobacter albidus]